MIISDDSLDIFSMGFLCQREPLRSTEHESWVWGGICCVPQPHLRAWCAGGFRTVPADRQSELSHADLVHILVLSLGQVTF